MPVMPASYTGGMPEEKNVSQEEKRPLVLIIEDDPDVSQLLRYRLEQRGYRVHHMDRGYQILRRLQELKPTMVVLDLMLPDCDGLELCRIIKHTARFADIPVIILTAWQQEEAVYEAVKAGADLFLRKQGFLKAIDAAAQRFCPVQ